jgi:hypothetical protein
MTTLSSYSLTLLLIAYLQTISHLPNLQSPELISLSCTPTSYLWARPKVVKARKGKGRRKQNDAPPIVPDETPSPPRVYCDTTFIIHLPEAARWTQTKFELVETLVGFFEFYAQFSWEENIVSISEGGVVPRAKKWKEPLVSAKKPRKTKKERQEEAMKKREEAEKKDEHSVSEDEGDGARTMIEEHTDGGAHDSHQVAGDTLIETKVGAIEEEEADLQEDEDDEHGAEGQPEKWRDDL